MLCYHAHLTQHPYPDELIPAELLQSPQLSTQDDFSAYRAFAKKSWAPILVSFAQKYRFMDSLLEIVETHLAAHYDIMLMTCRVPGTMRFPDRFNSDKVFLVADIDAEMQRLLARGARFAVIEEGIVRHPMEQGQNEFALRLQNPEAAAKAAFEACTQALSKAGLTPAGQVSQAA